MMSLWRWSQRLRRKLTWFASLMKSLFGKDNKDGLPWRGSAQELERELRQSKLAFAVERLIYSPSICGVYLARLALNEGSTFERRKIDLSVK